MIIVPHTHWDREWYRPYQEFRLALVEVLDALLDALASGEPLAPATLDGQTILLDDYLELRPERVEEVRHGVASGRLLIGPWYVQPDEFLASGEALVRSLLRGRRTAARFGPAMAVGYLADQFGHIAQMPQILRGFAIESSVFWRGRPREAGASAFRWQAPDGSSVLAVHLTHSYGQANSLPLEPVALARRIRELCAAQDATATGPVRLLMNGMDHRPFQLGLPAALAAAAPLLAPQYTVELGSLDGYVEAVQQTARDVEVGELRSPRSAPLLPGVLSTRLPLKRRNARLQTLLEREAEPWAALAGLVAPAGQGAAVAGPPGSYPRAELDLAWDYLLQNQAHDSICGCTIDQVAREVDIRFDWAEQVAAHVASAMLARLAHAVDTRRAGAAPPPGAAAATTGQTCAAVGPTAARAAQQSSEGHVWQHRGEVMDAAGAWRPATAALPEELALITFNSSDVDRTERARLTLTLPGGGADYEVVDAAGQPIPHRWLGEHGESSTIMELPVAEVPYAETVLAQIPGDRVMDLGVHDLRVAIEGDAVVADLTLGEQSVLTRAEIEEAVRYTGRLIEQAQPTRAVLRIHRSTRLELEFLARDVPAHGYRTAWLQRTTQRQPSTTHSAPCAPHHEVSTEWFGVRVDSVDGTLTIEDRRDGGAVYARCNAFVDGGDAGDTYTYAPPARDTVVSAPAGPPQVTLEDDPLGATLRVALELRVPAVLAASRGRRSPTMITLPLVSTVQLTHGVPRIDVTTTLENTARDHRLRVGFTAPFATDHAHAEDAFAVTRRPLALPGHTEGWAEQPAPTAPQQGFLAVHGRARATDGGAETPSDGAAPDGAPLDVASLVERALLVANKGLPEYEVRSEAGRTEVLLTVLRAVGWLSRDDLSTRAGHAGPGLPAPEAQCPGTHTASYALLPWAGDWHAAIPLARAAATALTTVAVPAGAAAMAADEERAAQPASTAAGRLPASGGFLRVTPARVAVSALKGAEDGRGLILRLCNLSATAVEARVELGLLAAVLRQVTRTSLAEIDEDALAVQHTADGGTALALALRPCEIVSVRLERGA